MSIFAFTDQRSRLRRIVEKALDGAAYESSRSEEPRMLVLEAKRVDGTRVILRFRGVRDSEANDPPAIGAPLRLDSVAGPAGGCLVVLIPFLPRVPNGAARVRIEAGATKLDIICEDAEWWEEPAPGATSGSTS